MNWSVERLRTSDTVRSGHRLSNAKLGEYLFMLLVAITVLEGCSRDRNTESPNRLMAEVKDEHGHCIFSVAGRFFEVGKDTDQIASFFKTLNTPNLEFHIASNIDTPLACIGRVVSTLQTAGAVRIGFISEPTTAGER